jgi:hypothetical protein
MPVAVPRSISIAPPSAPFAKAAPVLGQIVPLLCQLDKNINDLYQGKETDGCRQKSHLVIFSRF